MLIKTFTLLLLASASIAQTLPNHFSCKPTEETYQGATVSRTNTSVDVDWKNKTITQTVSVTRYPPFQNSGTATVVRSFKLDSAHPVPNTSSVYSVHGYDIRQSTGATISFVNWHANQWSVSATSDNLECDQDMDRGCVVIRGFEDLLCDGEEQ